MSERDFYDNPGKHICLYCPLQEPACDESYSPGQFGQVRVLRRQPVCPLNRVVWEIRHIPPNDALRLGDKAALITLGRGFGARAFWRAVAVYADRDKFTRSLPKRQLILPDAIPLEVAA